LADADEFKAERRRQDAGNGRAGIRTNWRKPFGAYQEPKGDLLVIFHKAELTRKVEYPGTKTEQHANYCLSA